MTDRNYMILLIIIVILSGLVDCQAWSEDWKPSTHSSDWRVKSATEIESRHWSPSNPHYVLSATGTLTSIDYESEDSVAEIGGKQYSKRRGLPMSSGMLKSATYEKFVSVHSDLDWQYADRRMEWTLLDAEFSKTKKLPKLDTPVKVSNLVRKASDDFAVYNDRTTVRLAQRIPIKSSTNFVITYQLRLIDLAIANPVDSASFCIPDATTGEFTVTTLGGEFRFRIRLPKLLDDEWNVISQNTLHTMQYLGDGLYEYKKYPSSLLSLAEMEAATWIDADTYYGSADYDGFIYSNVWWYTGSPSEYSRHFSGESNSISANIYRAYQVAAVENAGNPAMYVTTWLYRSPSIFNTQALPSTAIITSAKVDYEVILNNYTDTIYVYKGTYNLPFDNTNWDSFTGSSLGNVSVSSTGWKEITLSGTYSSFITLAGYTKFMLRGSYYDINHNQPGVGSNQLILIHSGGASGTSDDPYLVLVYTVPTVFTAPRAAAQYYYRMRLQ